MNMFCSQLFDTNTSMHHIFDFDPEMSLKGQVCHLKQLQSMSMMTILGWSGTSLIGNLEFHTLSG